MPGLIHLELLTDLFNKIGPKPTSRHVRYSVAIGVKADIKQGSLSKLDFWVHALPKNFCPIFFLWTLLQQGLSRSVPVSLHRRRAR